MKKFIAVMIIFVASIGYVGSAYYPTIQEQYALESIFKKIDNLFLVNEPKAKEFHNTVKNLEKHKLSLSQRKQFLLEQLVTYVEDKAFEKEYNTDESIKKFVTHNHGYTNPEYKPADLVSLNNSETITILSNQQFYISSRAHAPLLGLAESYAQQFGEPLSITSTRRGYHEQAALQHSAVCEQANKCAKPGHSEHQSGLAVDIAGLKDDRYNWMSHNAHKFGFHQSYQHGVDTDNYQEEDWHRRYLGIDFATYLHETGKTFTQWYSSQSNNSQETSS